MIKIMILAAAVHGSPEPPAAIERRIVHPDGTVETIYRLPNDGRRFEIDRADGKRIGIEESTDRKPRKKL